MHRRICISMVYAINRCSRPQRSQQPLNPPSIIAPLLLLLPLFLSLFLLLYIFSPSSLFFSFLFLLNCESSTLFDYSYRFNGFYFNNFYNKNLLKYVKVEIFLVKHFHFFFISIFFYVFVYF